MQKRQVYNPFLPLNEYIPDGEPHVFGDRIYLYGSHDREGGYTFCMEDYVVYSAPVDDLSDWRCEGVTYRASDDPVYPALQYMYAPDVVKGNDGRFYLYYCMGGDYGVGGYTGHISVAVCDTPAGKYEYYGDVSYSDGTPIGFKGEPFQFDPGVFMDDDGKLYLYTGFALRDNPLLLWGSKPTDYGPMCFEIDSADMLTVKKGPVYIGVGGYKDGDKNGYKGHLFLEASSMRKFDGKYYYIYSSLNSHELCYAVSDRPDGGFSFGGVLVSNGDIGIDGISDVKKARNNTGNTHGSLIEIKGKYYVFYHRQTNRKQSSRQACAEEIRFENGKFYQAKETSMSFSESAFCLKGEYPSYIACNLYGKDGTRFLSMIKHPKGNTPYITQDDKDYDFESSAGKGMQYIDNFCDGSVAGFKYFDFSRGNDFKKISALVSGKARGVMEVYVVKKETDNTLFKIDNEDKICSINLEINDWSSKQSFESEITDVETLDDNVALYFSYKGVGRFKFYSFGLQ